MEKTTFKCATCKGTYNGNPALKNGAGSFCDRCWQAMRDKRSNNGGYRFSRYKKLGICVWCGIDLVDENIASGKEVVCSTCDKNRNWLLKCIRATPHAAKYVASVEERECKERNARFRKMEQESLQANEHDDGQDQPENKSTDRLERLERMMEKLVHSLGGI